MAVHYYPGIGVVCYHFWPIKILTPMALDLSQELGRPVLRRVDRWLGERSLIRSTKVLDRDV